MRVYVRTYGCKVNQVDSEELAARLVGEGHVLVRDESLAQLYVINSCAVTAEAVAKVRKGVRRAASLPGVAQVLVSGCAAVLHADELTALSDKIVIIGGGVGDGLPPRGPVSASLRPPSTGSIPNSSSGHTRVPIKVQDGCENYCSYCIVPYARAACRSTSLDTLCQQVAELAANGTEEVVLTGINIGRYRDPETGTDLVGLIRALDERTGIGRIRLSSIEPPDVTDALCELLEEGILCEHLHIPLQSGSDSVLAAMGRHYTSAEYVEALARVRAAAPATAITTDVIVGYPTETEADFASTLALCRQQRFAKIHVFRFSGRAGTPAAALAPLGPRIVADRARRLRALSDELVARYTAACDGRTLEWIVERIDPATQTATLTSREHLVMQAGARGLVQGQLVELPFAMMKTSIPEGAEV